MSKKTAKKLSGGDVRTFLRLLRFARPYWPRLLLGTLCALVGGGSIIAMFVAAQHLLGFLLDKREVAQPAPIEATAGESPAEADPEAVAEAQIIVEDAEGGMTQSAGARAVETPAETPAEGLLKGADRKFLSRFIGAKDMQRMQDAGIGRMLIVCGVLMLIILVNSAAIFASIYLLQWVGQRVVMDLRVRFFDHLQRLSLGFHNTSRTGDMISRTVADTQMLQSMVSTVMTDLVRQPLTLLIIFTYIILTQWRLALFTVLLVPVCVLPINTIGHRVRRVSREGQVRLAELTSVMQESLAGVSVIRAFGQEERASARFAEQCRRFFGRMMSAIKAKALNDPVTHILGGLCGTGVLLYTLITSKPLEECIIFALAIWMLYEPLKKLGRISMEVQQTSAAADRIFEVLDTPVTILDRPGARPLDEPLRELALENVQFSYEGADGAQVFTHLDLRIPAGQSLAVVGPSGCGKSTLVSLLLRFFDVTGGAIRYNETDIRDCTMESLRSRIGLVMQDTFLFADTVAANIAFGSPEASMEQIRDAARRANADAFIDQLPNGYDTVLGERGVGLSGGQRQRLAIARAILRQPPILILDEATSALDTQAERVVQADIERLMGVYTVIVVAHRLSTVAKCDRIAVLGEGGILEYGTHAELLKLGGVYRELHDLQFTSQKGAEATVPEA